MQGEGRKSAEPSAECARLVRYGGARCRKQDEGAGRGPSHKDSEHPNRVGAEPVTPPITFAGHGRCGNEGVANVLALGDLWWAVGAPLG